MDTLALVITAAGLDALVDAQNGDTESIRIDQVGLTEQAFDAAPTLEVLPGEFKRIGSVSGQSIAANVIHMTAQDVTADAYDLRGIALYLADGTLFATYGQADPLFRKVSIASFLLAFDVAFSGDVASEISFGDASFLYPPATETVKGVAEIATEEETAIGADDVRMVTPRKLRQRLDPLEERLAAEELARAAGDASEAEARQLGDVSLNERLDVLEARRFTGDGLVSGGGDLSDDRVISVDAASGDEVAAGTEVGKAVTPAAIGAVPQTFGGSPSVLGLGGAILKAGTFTVPSSGSTNPVFPIAFPNACSRVLISPMGHRDPGKEADQWITATSRTGFSVATSGGGSSATFAYFALGH